MFPNLAKIYIKTPYLLLSRHCPPHRGCYFVFSIALTISDARPRSFMQFRSYCCYKSYEGKKARLLSIALAGCVLCSRIERYEDVDTTLPATQGVVTTRKVVVGEGLRNLGSPRKVDDRASACVVYDLSRGPYGVHTITLERRFF
jgi:hypothetical protein